MAAKFRLSMGQIVEAAEVARLTATARGDERAGRTPTWTSARARRRPRGSASWPRGSRPATRWDDLVVPERQLELLQSISAYLRHRDRVLSDWGYDRSVARTQGLKVLFAGESGTGKTMAAQVLAAELGLELFRVDLATIVSKYIGETEKNLDRIFGAADGSNAILFFDEADALFGKRSEVSDSHDRYANIEVAYLLQKMEGYAGAVILATNFRRNIDDAFVRRLDFVIDFPFPEAEDRKRIWRLLLPEEAPIADDLDIDFLATQFKLSGGGDPQLLAVGRLPGRRRRRRDRHAPPRARGRARVRQAGPAHARGRLRELPRADPRRRAAQRLGLRLSASSASPVGSTGRVSRHGAIRPGRTGEVLIEIRGGVEAFLARDADGGAIEADEEIVVIEQVAPRTVLVTRLYERKDPS